MRPGPFTRAATILVLATVLVLTTASLASAGVSRAWTHQFGRDGTDIAEGVAVDADRNVFVAGRIRSGGSDQCFVRKYLPDGRRRWMRIFGTTAGEDCRGLAVSRNGSVYVVGHTNGSLSGSSAGGQDAFVRKYRPDGSVAWTRQFGSSVVDQAHGVAVDDAGNVLVAGHTGGSIGGNPPRGGWDGFVRKYRSNGRHVWTRQFGTAADEFVADLAVDPSRRIVVTGQTFGSLRAPYRGAGDVYVRKLRPNGNHLWTRQFGTSAEDWGFGLAVTTDERIYVVGRTEGVLPTQTAGGGSDGFVRKLRPDGSSIWTRQFGTPGDDWAWAAAVDSAGRIYVAGGIYVISTDAYVMKMKPDGSRAWIKKTGSGSAYDGGRGVAVDRLKHVYLAGMSNGALAGQTWSGGWDAWVRKYKP